MPKNLEHQLARRADTLGLEKKRAAAYIYGTLRKTGWKPKREKAKGRGGFGSWTRAMRSAAAKKGWLHRARATASRVVQSAPGRFARGVVGGAAYGAGLRGMLKGNYKRGAALMIGGGALTRHAGLAGKLGFVLGANVGILAGSPRFRGTVRAAARGTARGLAWRFGKPIRNEPYNSTEIVFSRKERKSMSQVAKLGWMKRDKKSQARDAFKRYTKTAKELSLEAKAQAIRDGLREAASNFGSECWITEVFDGYVIVSEGDKNYRVEWGKNQDGTYWLAPKEKWVQVVRSWEEVDEMDEKEFSSKARGGGFATWTRSMRSAAAKKAAATRLRKYGAAVKKVGTVVAAGKKRFMEGRGKLFTGRQAAAAAKKTVKIGAAVGRVVGATTRYNPAARASLALGGALAHGAAYRVGRLRSNVRAIGRTARTVGRVAARAGRAYMKRAADYYGRAWRGEKEFEVPAELSVFKEKDDYRWVMISSNAFRDQDGEIVSLKALQDDVARWEEAGSPPSPLRWWHVPISTDWSRGLELGNTDFRMVYGRSLIESGTFLTKEIAEAVYNAKERLSGSIGFRHAPGEPDSDKVFNAVQIFERSFLPKERRSNLLVAMDVA